MTPAPHSAGEAEANPIHVARPLSVLAELIQKDLDDAEAAGMEYFKAAGEKLIEAKAQLKHGEFGAWVKTNFNISTATSARYMAMASVANLSIGINFKSQYEFRKKFAARSSDRRSKLSESKAIRSESCGESWRSRSSTLDTRPSPSGSTPTRVGRRRT